MGWWLGAGPVVVARVGRGMMERREKVTNKYACRQRAILRRKNVVL